MPTVTDPDLLALALSGHYVGDTKTLGRILLAEIRRVTRERDYAIGVLARLNNPLADSDERDQWENRRLAEDASWYRRTAGEAVWKLKEGKL